MSDDELFDLYLNNNETIITSLRAIYDKGKVDGRADTIEECIEKLYEVTPQTADEKLDMVFVNALEMLKEKK